MQISWQIERDEIDRLCSYVTKHAGKSLIQHRMKINVAGAVQDFSRVSFWRALVQCLLTTQQRSGSTSPVMRYVNKDPFPLEFNLCKAQLNLNQYASQSLSEFGGIRRLNIIGKELDVNLKWLEAGGWEGIETHTAALRACLRNAPNSADKAIEREAADFARQNLHGIGPKQARNLWQMLGLTRFEIPIDSRVVKWLNDYGFPVKLSASALSDPNYYNFIMDGIQELCTSANVFPCILDAVIFSENDDGEWPEMNSPNRN